MLAANTVACQQQSRKISVFAAVVLLSPRSDHGMGAEAAGVVGQSTHSRPRIRRPDRVRHGPPLRCQLCITVFTDGCPKCLVKSCLHVNNSSAMPACAARCTRCHIDGKARRLLLSQPRPLCRRAGAHATNVLVNSNRGRECRSRGCGMFLVSSDASGGSEFAH
jgi:hypothetical protein